MNYHKKSPYPIPHTLYPNAGFSLIEVLVAISVLLLAVTATLTVAAKSISISADARDQVTASFLAEEGVEFIRNKRDTNILSGQSWRQGLDPCFELEGCTTDTRALEGNQIGQCVDSCPALLFSDAGVYGYELGDQTHFVREVRLTELAPDREILVSVTLRWKRQFIERSFTIDEHLFNWQ